MSLRLPHQRTLADFRRRLSTWYRAHGRHDLPWRGTFAPYPVLVSEFMLQQTTVSTVVPYFHRFLKAFPTLPQLARAPLERVLQQWAGLGYYARARNLHRTAQRLLRDHKAKVPMTREQAERLPGVGPYTAGALLSFAYDQPEAVVDGNVIRVLSRVFGITGDARRPAVIERIWGLARALVPLTGGRHFNSALMDFGAMLCKAGLPRCPGCPLATLCWALKNGRVDEIPESRPDKAKTIVRLSAFQVEKEGGILLLRRPLGGLWGGLWELPMGEGLTEKGKWTSVGGTTVEPHRRVRAIRHLLSHRDLRVEIWQARLVRQGAGARFVMRAKAGQMAISSLTEKILFYTRPRATI